MNKIPVSVMILTYNEQCNIERCVEALSVFEEIIVVDSGSTDQTTETLAKQFPSVRVYERAFTDFGDQRNWAIENTNPRFEWILFVDADEFMEPSLADEIADFVQQSNEHVGGFIAGRNYFMGQWLKHCTFYPSYQLRLLKIGSVRYRKEGHGQREVVDGSTAYLKHGWHHAAFSHGIHQWIERHNRYSSDEVELILRLRREPLGCLDFFGEPLARRRMLKRLLARLPGRAIVRIFYTYILRLGFLDGRAGFWFCVLRFSHECHIMAKVAEATSHSKISCSENQHNSSPMSNIE